MNRGQEAAPIVVGNTMYVVAPFPNYLYALDLTKPGAPLKWKFEPNPDASSHGVACCDLVNRGVAYSDGSKELKDERASEEPALKRQPVPGGKA